MIETIALRRPAWRLSARTLAGATIAVTLALTVFVTLGGEMKDDIAWLLYVAQQWLHGSRLYVDVVEVNPPLIIWICAVPAWIARATGAPMQPTAMLFFMAIVLGCLLWAVQLLTRTRAPLGHPLVLFAAAAPAMLLIPGGEFGQREHLLIAAALPYLAVMIRELEGDAPSLAVRLTTAVLAAVGCALKPRYLIAFGAVELYAVWQGLRLLRPATLAATATLAAYVGAIALFEWDFFREAVPMAFALYGVSDVPLLDMLFECRLLLLGLAAGCVLLVTHPSRRDPSRVPTLLLVFALGATVVCVGQGKNWFYHQIPATIASILCLVAWALLRLRSDWRAGWRTLGPALLAGVALLQFGLSAYERLDPQMRLALAHGETTEERLAALIKREHATSYVALSDWIGLGFPVVNQTGVTWASRFDSMWALDGEMWRAARDGHAPPDWPIRKWVASDFTHACPDIVVIDRRSPLDYVAVLSRADPAFLQLWRRYVRIASFNGLVVFKLTGPTDGRPDPSCLGRTTTVRNRPVQVPDVLPRPLFPRG